MWPSEEIKPHTETGSAQINGGTAFRDSGYTDDCENLHRERERETPFCKSRSLGVPTFHYVESLWCEIQIAETFRMF